MLMADPAETKRRAQALARALRRAAPGLEVALQADTSRLGSGSLPEEPLPTTVIALTPPDGNADALLEALRQAEPPVFARIGEDRVLLDPRTVLPGEERPLVSAVAWAVQRCAS